MGHDILRLALAIWVRIVVPVGGIIVSGTLLLVTILRIRGSDGDRDDLIHIGIVSGVAIALAVGLLVMANLKRYRVDWREPSLELEDGERALKTKDVTAASTLPSLAEDLHHSDDDGDDAEGYSDHSEGRETRS